MTTSETYLTRAWAVAVPESLGRARALEARIALTSMIAVSFVLRFVAALAHPTPRYFPDEYIYAELSRSIAHGSLSIRGIPTRFPAMLEPLLTAPFWLGSDPAVAMRLTQAMHALAVSLIALPVFLLARRVRLDSRTALLCALVALALPSLVFASYLSADAIGILLVLLALHAALRLLDESTWRRQLAFLLLAGGATFARTQYVVLIPVFLVAALAMTRWRPLEAVRRYSVVSVALLVPLSGVVLLGPSRSLGYYQNILNFQFDIPTMLGWGASDALLLAYASGFVLIPAAVVGVVAAIVRPRFAEERAFAILAAALAACLFAEAMLYATNGSARFQERYLMALCPLIPILFALGMARADGKIARLGITAVGVVLAGAAVRSPLSGFSTGEFDQDSPFLQAVTKLIERWGPGTGAEMILILATALAAIAIAAAYGPRRGTPVALVVAAVVLSGAAYGASSIDADRATQVRMQFLPADPSWIDDARLGEASVLVTPGSFRPAVSVQMFWNASVTRILQMHGAETVDAFGAGKVRIRSNGTILADGKVVSEPLVVMEYADAVELEGARLVSRAPGASLWQTAGPARLAMLTYGRYQDGLLAWPRSTITVWPNARTGRRATLCLKLSIPAETTSTVTLRGVGLSRLVHLAPHVPKTVAIPVRTGSRPWKLDIGARQPLLAGDRQVSAFVERPTLVDSSAQGSRQVCR